MMVMVVTVMVMVVMVTMMDQVPDQARILKALGGTHALWNGTKPNKAGPARTRCRTRRGFRGSSKRNERFLWHGTRPDQGGPGRTRCRTRQNGEDVSGETRVFLEQNQAGPGRTRHRTRRNCEDVSGETCVFFDQNQAGPGRTRPDQVPDQAWIPRKL